MRMEKVDEARIEKLSRAVAKAWGFEPDLSRVLEGGVVGKLWEIYRIRECVLAYLAMRKVDRE